MRFAIYAPPFTDYIGGVVVLYQLAWFLNRLGFEAKIWPRMKPSLNTLNSPQAIAGLLKYPYRDWRYSRDYHSPYDIGLVREWTASDWVVVYPEIVCGNPVGARRVCRWLLNTPGAVQGNEMGAGSDDLFFHYHAAYLPANDRYRNSAELRILIANPVYQRRNFGERQGVCYLVRKGRDRSLDSHPKDAILIDPLSHEEKCEVFNRCEFFLSYDDCSLYSAYAAICGCKSIVIPRHGQSIADWGPEGLGMLGVAYGWDDLPRAQETLPQLFQLMEKWTQESSQSVAQFVSCCQHHFG